MLYVLDIFGTAVFAVSGALAAGRKQMDLFGAVVLAVVTAVGGGTFRDLVLGATPVFWIRDPWYLGTATAAALITFGAARITRVPAVGLQLADAVGLATFTVIGTQAALGHAVSPAVAVLMGVMTGVLGGMVRDVLAGEVPLVLRREIYATASLCGAVVLVGLQAVGTANHLAVPVAAAVTLALRLVALRWKLSLPIFPTPR